MMEPKNDPNSDSNGSSRPTPPLPLPSPSLKNALQPPLPPTPTSPIPKEIKHLIAGGLAGMFAKSIVAPVDRIKILYQVTNTPFHLRDIPGVVSGIIRNEGFTALWKGNTATMIRIFPYAGIQFMVFNRCKSHFIGLHHHPIGSAILQEERGVGVGINGASVVEGDGMEAAETTDIATTTDAITDTTTDTTTDISLRYDLSPAESLVAGSTAGFVSVLCTYPLDLTRAQLAVLKKDKTKPGHGFTSVLTSNYTRGGYSGLFRGIAPTVLGILPYAGIAFTINEQAKRQVYKITNRDPNNIEKIQCGALSGLIAQSMTYPLEVTRRRMQTIGVVPISISGKVTAVDILGGSVETKPALNAATTAEGHLVNPHAQQQQQQQQKMQTSMFRVIRQVMKEQGMRGFFKGLSMNWLKGPVGFSISFTTFDILKDMIDEEEERWLLSNRRHEI